MGLFGPAKSSRPLKNLIEDSVFGHSFAPFPHMRKITLLSVFSIFFSLQTLAIDTGLLITFAQQGVPTSATIRVLGFLDTNDGAKITADGKRHVIQGDHAAIIDFSLPSTSKRFFLLDLKTGDVKKYYTSHGRNSGMLQPTRFSNIKDSKTSSLGLVVTGETYTGIHGFSLNLHGLEKHNALVYKRRIVIHGADYVSEDFIRKYNRLGVSWGCPAVEDSVLPEIIKALPAGSLVYFYHPRIEPLVTKNPQKQELIDMPQFNEPIIDLPGEEEDFQSKL